MVLLAQLIAPEPPPLPRGPLWAWFLCESPAALACAIMALAVAGAWALRSKGRGRSATTLIALGVLLAGGGALVSLSVETGREQIARSTRRFVERVAQGDHAAIEGMLTDRASVRVLGARQRVEREQIVPRVKEDMNGRYALRGRRAEVSRVQACIDGPGVGRTQFRLQATHEASGYPVGMWWVVHWRIERDAWRLSGLELVAFDGMSPDADPGF